MTESQALGTQKALLLFRLGVAVVMATASVGGHALAADGEEVEPRTPADRLMVARARATLATLEGLIEKERARPRGAPARRVIDRWGHRLILFATGTDGVAERIHSFEPGFALRSLYALVLDSEHRVRLFLIEPMSRQEAYEIDQYLFAGDGGAIARDHTYGTFTDCADGRIHERRIVTVFGPRLRVLQRKVEFLNELAGQPLTLGCALEADRPPFSDAASLLRAHGLERLASEAGLRVGPGP